MENIFISYRRDDTLDITGRMYDVLAQRFGRQQIFKDVDSIFLGTNYRDRIREVLNQCGIMLVVIGKQWLTILNDEDKPRILDPEDYLRSEIEMALARNIVVIPVLVQNTPMPPTRNLPSSLKQLADRQAFEVRSDPYFHRDMQQLIDALQRIQSPQRANPPYQPPLPPSYAPPVAPAQTPFMPTPSYPFPAPPAATPTPIPHAAPVAVQTLSPPTKKRFALSNEALIGGALAGVVLIALAVFLILRFSGILGGSSGDPSMVVKNYFTDLFVNYNAQSAYNLECPSYQSQETLSQLQQLTNTSKSTGFTYNINGLTYTTTDQSSTLAHVRVSGSIGINYSGTSTMSPGNSIVTLDASGSSWCIAGGATVTSG